MKTVTSLKKYFFLPLALCLGLSAQAQTNLAEQDFDSATSWSYSSDTTYFSHAPNNSKVNIYPSPDGWTADGFYGIIDIANTTTLDYANLSGNILGEVDLNDEGDFGTSGEAKTTFAAIDISSYTNVALSFDYDVEAYNANSDDASYQLIYDGTPQGEVILQTGATTGDDAEGSVSVNIPSTVNSVSLEIIIQNNGSGYSGFDNFLLQELAGLQPPSDLSASTATSPNNKDSLAVTFTPDGTNDVLLVYSTADTFGTPVDATTYSAGDSITGGGTVAGVFSSSPANITGLIPGTVYYVAAYSIDGSVSYSSVSSSTSGTTDSFAIQTTGFGDGTTFSVASNKDWSTSASSASAGNFGGDAPAEDWLINSVIDLDASINETYEFTYRGQYSDTITGLEVFYTTSYTGDPSTTTWTPFTALNTELDDYVASGSSSEVTTSVDLSGIAGTTVSLAFKYTSSGTGSGTTRNWYLSDALFSGNNASDPAITLSPTPASVAEGASLAVTLTLPSTVSGDTDFFLSSNGDGSELSFPASVTVLDGTSSIGFNVDGLTDSTLDGDLTVGLTANAAGYTLSTLNVTVTDSDAPTPSSDIIFTQYYEGSSSNKWVEITNIGDSTVDLNAYQVAVWSNANTEAWKADGAGSLTADYTLDLTGVSLAAGQSYVIANSSAVLPYSSSLADANSSITYFNGNDSLILYTDPTGYLTSNISDAIAFTNSGFEGGNKGFIRTQAYVGYDFDAGSSIEDYDDDNSGPAVWTEITTAAADDATIGNDAYIGTTALATPPSEVSFTTTTQSVSESDGNIDLNVQVTGLSSGTLTVQVDFNADNSTADLTDITYSAPQQLTFDASSLVSPQTITIPIVDDGLDGGVEIASFDLSIVSGTALLATPSTHNVSINDVDFAIPDIFISEIVDPQVEWRDGRYVELYNATDSDVDLAAGNWNLVIYFNANTSGTDIPLTGTIPAGGTYIIAQDATNFSSVYSSVTQDQGSSSVNSNGDDNFELLYGGDQSTGTLVDVYGSPGTDGTGDPWEFENDRAVRNADVTTGNTTWTASEWTIESTSVSTGNMTPGVHPDPSVNEPTGVAASAVSDTEISLAYAAIGSNDVIIVFDTDGTFTAPSGTAPSLGDSFAGGTVIYVGQVSPFAHTGLTASTQYYYSVFSVNGTDYSSTIEVNATTQVEGLINSEVFEVASAQWTPQAIAGTSAPGWDNDNSGTAAVDGYVLPSGSASTEIHYLVSPELDFSSVSGTVTVSLDYEGAANTVNDSLKLVYSTSYAGSGDPEDPNTWTEVDFTFVNTNSGSPTSVLNDSAEITLPSSLNGQSTVYLALRYEAGGEASNSEYWTIDNILVVEAAAADPVAEYLTARSLTSDDLATDTNGNGFTVLEEYLAGFGDGSGPDAISYGIVNNALTLTSDLESAPSGITVVLQATNDLSVAFANVAFTASVVDNGDTTYTRSYTETSPPAGDQRFLRLSITTD